MTNKRFIPNNTKEHEAFLSCSGFVDKSTMTTDDNFTVWTLGLIGRDPSFYFKFKYATDHLPSCILCYPDGYREYKLPNVNDEHGWRGYHICFWDRLISFSESFNVTGKGLAYGFSLVKYPTQA